MSHQIHQKNIFVFLFKRIVLKFGILHIVTAAISFLANGTMTPFGNKGCRRLLANVNDIIALVLGL